jgi:multisubunit Na+/H+ antiporter MnhF subunit
MFTTILDIFTFMIAMSLASMVFQVWRNRTVPDRAVAADQISVHVMALIALHAIRQDVSAYVDLLIVFSMLGFFSSIALARYFEASVQKENRSS